MGVSTPHARTLGYQTPVYASQMAGVKTAFDGYHQTGSQLAVNNHVKLFVLLSNDT